MIRNRPTLIGIVLLMLQAHHALACRCQPLDIGTYFAQADIVVLASVDSIEHIDKGATAYNEASVTVEHFYKASAAVSKIRSAGSSAACGLPLLVGSRYWLFGERVEPGILEVHSCNGSRPAESGFLDLEASAAPATLETLAKRPASCSIEQFDSAIARFSIQQSASKPLAKATLSPNGAYGFTFDIAGKEQRPPHIASLHIDREQNSQLLLQLHNASLQAAPSWVNEKLLFVAPRWSAKLSSEVLIDVEHGRVLYHRVNCD